MPVYIVRREKKGEKKKDPAHEVSADAKTWPSKIIKEKSIQEYKNPRLAASIPLVVSRKSRKA